METSTSPWATPPWGIKVILFDLWKTIARGPYPEPITNFRVLLGLDGKVNNEDFLRVCLTTNEEDPQLYMQKVAARYGLFDLRAEALEEFLKLIRTEKNGLLTYNDLGEGNRALWALREQGYRLGLVTNSWPFPISSLLKDTGLDQVFEHVIVSAMVCCAKQEGPRIYTDAANLFGVLPSECCMVGDNPCLDIYPALEAGLRTILIDRDEAHLDAQGLFKDQEMEKLGVRAIRSLKELPSNLR